MNPHVNARSSILVFDLDGTLVPSTEPGIQKFQKILSELKLPACEDELIRVHWGKPFREIVSLICRSVGGNDKQIEEFIRIEHMLDDNIHFDTRLPWTLDQLRRRYYLALVTSRRKNSFTKLTRLMNFDPHTIFSFLQTYDDCHCCKPDPAVFNPLFTWAAKLNISPAQITYFGDTVDYDWRAAKAAGLRFTGIVSGASKASEFLSAGVTDLVYKISGLPGYLEDKYLHSPDTSSPRKMATVSLN